MVQLRNYDDCTVQAQIKHRRKQFNINRSGSTEKP